MLPFIIIAALAGALPNIDLNKACEGADISSGDNGDVASCINDEKAAKERIAKKWSKYTASEHETCTGNLSLGMGMSYVEIETCLQMEDWKKTPEDIGGSQVPGAHGPQRK